MGRLLALGLVLLGSACATPATPPRPGDDTDQAQVSSVERTARERGVRVYWVNPPRKPESPEATKPGG